MTYLLLIDLNELNISSFLVLICSMIMLNDYHLNKTFVMVPHNFMGVKAIREQPFIKNCQSLVIQSTI